MKRVCNALGSFLDTVVVTIIRHQSSINKNHRRHYKSDRIYICKKCLYIYLTVLVKLQGLYVGLFLVPKHLHT